MATESRKLCPICCREASNPHRVIVEGYVAPFHTGKLMTGNESKRWYPLSSILDAPYDLGSDEAAEAENNTPTDCTPYPVYVPTARPASPDDVPAPISRWWDKWVDLALRPFSVALGVFGIV